MTNIVRWQARRGAQGATLQQCIQEPKDLGRLSHVQKVLLKTFAGGQIDGAAFIWSTPMIALTARPEQTDRPRFVDIEVHLTGLTADEAVIKLSPRLRRLAEDRAWVIFDVESTHALLLAPPKPAPRRKKGLTTIPIDVETLLSELAGHGPGRTLIVGGLADVAALDRFLHATPPPETLTGLNGSLRWTNHEIRLPVGTRFFPIYFRGQAADTFYDWYTSAAASAGLTVAAISDGDLQLPSTHEPRTYDLHECHLFGHNIWESSIATRH